jgi:hypothetical protein
MKMSEAQAQTGVAFTSAGSAGTLTVTTSPAYGVLAAGQRMRLKFNVASTGTDTLNRDATGAKSLKQYDSTGAKVAAAFAANQLADVVYDGTDYVVLDQLPISPLPSQTGNSGKVLTTNGAVASWGNALQSGTAVAATSGTAIDFTGIPTWAKRITILFNGLSVSGTNPILVQIGSGAIVSTGYSSNAAGAINGTAQSIASSTAGFLLFNDNAADVRSGSMTIALVGSNAYVESHNAGGTVGRSIVFYGGGAITLSGILDRVRIAATGGDSFDAGSINILYE